MEKSAVKILLVEDNDFYRELFVRHLNQEGYEKITQACDGREALDLIPSDNFDVVLLDVMMPNVDGYGVLEQLKQDPKLRHIPVIMISAVEEIESVIKCIELGAEDYLPKPVNSTLLRARLGACLEKKSLRDQEQIYLEQIEIEKLKVDELLNITLPSAAATELKEKGFVEPRRFENVAVLFCDVVQFTKFCDQLSPEEIIDHVTELIECLEDISHKHGMEKIKTIGDEFMATAGLLVPNDEPVNSVVKCGLAMSSAAEKLKAGWQVRIGIDYGPVVAGIVGTQKYQFDLWGDTVNTASRMTRYGNPGTVTMTKLTSEYVTGDFIVESLGEFEIKGKGVVEVVACTI
jgi:adenylate cyclase